MNDSTHPPRVPGEYVELDVLDLSEIRLLEDGRLDFENANMSDLVARALHAFQSVGFAAFKGLGLSKEGIQHQFDIGKLLNVGVSEAEKRALHADIGAGSWAGYKASAISATFSRPVGAISLRRL